MKRTIALVVLGLAAAFVPATAANADHLCVYSHGRPVRCVPHVGLEVERICVETVDYWEILCVPS